MRRDDSPIGEALHELGTRRLVLAIHGASFPSDPEEDLGAGSPGTAAAERLFDFAAALGFTGIQLGPSGELSRDNASPYDGTIFSRSIAAIPKRAYAAGGELEGLVSERVLAVTRGDGGMRADHGRAHDTSHALLATAWSAFSRGARPDLAPRLAEFERRHRAWLERDALFEVLRELHGSWDARTWPAAEARLWEAPDAAAASTLTRDHARAIAAYGFGQFLAHAAHDRVRAIARRAGLALLADLQVGFSPGDAWAYRGAFLEGYRMGAPPSRTNPAGQPWGYPVLDPDRMGAEGAARALVRARIEKTLSEHDGLRIDHPHGLVCPWVYRDGTDDPARAVREGARLFESPDLPDHPALARHAIAAADQIDHAQPRYADGWVRALTAAQVDRYAVLIDELVAAATAHGWSTTDLSCEVLSTLPAPLARVLARHGLGRWRVLQKANLDDPTDVYRAENAEPADWVMLGNHDTASIAGLHAVWDDARRARWASHLASRLGLSPAAATTIAASPGTLAGAMFAEALASRAESALVFFGDLFGYAERFNTPGTYHADNWALRLPATFAEDYRTRVAEHRALCLPYACGLALHARRSPRRELQGPALRAASRDAQRQLITRLAEQAAAAGTPLPAEVTAG